MKNRKIIAIVGPTASGKTGIGVRLARELNGEIISADSRQVYRGLNIGSGKEHFDDVRQWLIDVADPDERFTLFDWLKGARAAIEDIFSRGKVPIIVGGTGLYVQALVEGFELERIENPHFAKASRGRQESRIKTEFTDDLNNLTVQELANYLKEINPQVYSQVDKSNQHRLIRAIERTHDNLKPVKIKPDFEVLQIGIELERGELFKKIDDRVEQRFDQGMLEEVLSLISSGVNINWLIKLGLEHRVITEFVLENYDSPVVKTKEPKNLGTKEQETDEILRLQFYLAQDNIKTTAGQLKSLLQYQEMKQALKYKIHAFARRQMTWFRRFPDITWLNEYSKISQKVKIFLESEY